MNYKFESFDKAILDRCKYLLCLDDDKFMNEMYDPLEKDENGYAIKDTEGYIHQVKKLCRKFIFNPDPENPNIGKIKQTYKYSKTFKGKGRLFVYGFGLQNLQNKLRAFLVEGIYKDFDIVNSAPTIIYNMASQIEPNKEFKFLHKYITKRNKFFELTGCNKVDILVRMFSDKIYNTNNSVLKYFDKDMKEIQKIIWDKDEYPELKDATKKNKYGSYLSKVYFVKENEILQKSKKKLKLDVPIFDGAYIEETEEYTEDKILEILNNNNFNVKFINKPIKTDIIIDKDILESYDEQIRDYESVKLKFEETHFFIRHPPTYGEILTDSDGVEKVYIYKKNEFSALVEDVDFEIFSQKLGIKVSKEFFKVWSKDSSKRAYDRIDFIPNENFNNPKIFNTFTGFRINKLDLDYNYNEVAVKDYLDHLNLLVNYEEDAFKYLVNYFADMYQNPDKIPSIALLFRSPQGCGKDTMIDFHSAILGKEFTFRTDDIEKVLGGFNEMIQKKIIVQLNELQGVDGFRMKEKLKNIITTEYLNINPKGRTPYDILNFLRMIIFSNNLTPIDIPYDDRRFVVFLAKIKKGSEYFENLRKHLKDENALRSIYDYFMSLDLSNFNITDRPKTEAYKNMRNNNVSPVYNYLYDIFKNDEYKEDFEDEFKVHKKTGNILIQSSALFRNFKYYLEEKGLNYKLDFKKLKSILSDIDIVRKQFKVAGSVKDYYTFNKTDLLKILKDRGVVEEIEELDDDEYF